MSRTAEAFRAVPRTCDTTAPRQRDIVPALHMGFIVHRHAGLIGEQTGDVGSRRVTAAISGGPPKGDQAIMLRPAASLMPELVSGTATASAMIAAGLGCW